MESSLEWSSAWRKRNMPLRLAICGGFVIIFAMILYAPGLATLWVLNLAGCLILTMASLRLLAIFLAVFPARRKSVSDPQIWPHYTVLVPLYQEAHMVTALMQSLAKLQYPREKLRIVMVCEADDKSTCRAVENRLVSPFQIFKVPPALPRTKPKALNAALASLPVPEKGGIVTVYDAEDRPHPLQLKQAARALFTDRALGAVQAPLGYYNDRDNLLTGLFGLEYAALFHIWNPALVRLGLPFTLGGTSNHIKREILDAVGGWDSHNVTEDADLSFRMSALARPGKPLKIGCINYGTEEEAVNTGADWEHQRIRWLKGFMQTWCVHMRKKKAAPDGKNFHPKSRILNTVSLQITVGVTLLAAFLHVPSLIIIAGLYLADILGLVSILWPGSFFTTLFIGYGSAILMGMAGAVQAKKFHLILLAPLMPFYWLLYFRPALRATHEFVIAPSHWRKTNHKGDNTSIVPIPSRRKLEPVEERPI